MRAHLGEPLCDRRFIGGIGSELREDEQGRGVLGDREEAFGHGAQLQQSAGDQLLEHLHAGGDLLLQQSEEEVVLAVEVRVERALGESGSLGDLREGRTVEADVEEDVLGGCQDLRPHLPA